MLLCWWCYTHRNDVNCVQHDDLHPNRREVVGTRLLQRQNEEVEKRNQLCMYSATQGVGTAVTVLLACFLIRSCAEGASTLSVARPLASVPVISRHLATTVHAACFRLTRHTSRPPCASAMWVRERTRDRSKCDSMCAPPSNSSTAHQGVPSASFSSRSAVAVYPDEAHSL